MAGLTPRGDSRRSYDSNLVLQDCLTACARISAWAVVAHLLTAHSACLPGGCASELTAEGLLSRFIPTSDVSRINCSAGRAVIASARIRCGAGTRRQAAERCGDASTYIVPLGTCGNNRGEDFALPMSLHSGGAGASRLPRPERE
jgi:hypothetical protein